MFNSHLFCAVLHNHRLLQEGSRIARGGVGGGEWELICAVVYARMCHCVCCLFTPPDKARGLIYQAASRCVASRCVATSCCNKQHATRSKSIPSARGLLTVLDNPPPLNKFVIICGKHVSYPLPLLLLLLLHPPCLFRLLGNYSYYNLC